MRVSQSHARLQPIPEDERTAIQFMTGLPRFPSSTGKQIGWRQAPGTWRPRSSGGVHGHTVGNLCLCKSALYHLAGLEHPWSDNADSTRSQPTVLFTTRIHAVHTAAYGLQRQRGTKALQVGVLMNQTTMKWTSVYPHGTHHHHHSRVTRNAAQALVDMLLALHSQLLLSFSTGGATPASPLKP